MTVVTLYITTFILFICIDFFGLSYIVKPVFTQRIAPLMRDSFAVLPAIAFYAFFIFVLLWFVSLPALTQGKTFLWVFANAALIGAVAYGTYEFTNLAILKDWTWRMVWTDVIWGTVLTAVSATLGLWVTRALIG
ncbi:MAG: DUF2177 family protein [Sulfitobacter sp.]